MAIDNARVQEQVNSW